MIMTGTTVTFMYFFSFRNIILFCLLRVLFQLSNSIQSIFLRGVFKKVSFFLKKRDAFRDALIKPTQCIMSDHQGEKETPNWFYTAWFIAITFKNQVCFAHLILLSKDISTLISPLWKLACALTFTYNACAFFRNANTTHGKWGMFQYLGEVNFGNFLFKTVNSFSCIEKYYDWDIWF